MVKKYTNQFKEALSSDLNTSLAVTALYDVIKDETLTNNTKLTLIEKFDSVLSLNLLKEEASLVDDSLRVYIEQKIAERLQAKKDKNYALADAIRTELAERGVTLKDTPSGTEYIIY